MAVVLCGIGLALTRWRDRVERCATGRRVALPVTAGLIVVVGLVVRATALLP